MRKKEFYIGFDLHKRVTTYSVRHLNGKIVAEGQCATIYDDLRRCLEPYLFSCIIGVEASTSYYSIYKQFKQNGYDIIVANVIQIRQLIAKNDTLDARRLSDMLRLGSFPKSYIPDEDVQRLRNMVHMRHNFVKQSTRLKNQIQALMDKNNIQVPCKIPFTKKWCNWLEKAIISRQYTDELEHLYDWYKFIRSKIDKITIETTIYCEKTFKQEFQLLQTIIGIGPTLAAYLIAEICPISRFRTKKKLRRYAGIVPCNKESAGKRLATYVPKVSCRKLLKWALIEASNAGVRSKSKLKEYYKKKKKQKGAQKAMVATASSLCDIVYNVLKNKKEYHAS